MKEIKYLKVFLLGFLVSIFTSVILPEIGKGLSCSWPYESEGICNVIISMNILLALLISPSFFISNILGIGTSSLLDNVLHGLIYGAMLTIVVRAFNLFDKNENRKHHRRSR